MNCLFRQEEIQLRVLSQEKHMLTIEQADQWRSVVKSQGVRVTQDNPSNYYWSFSAFIVFDWKRKKAENDQIAHFRRRKRKRISVGFFGWWLDLSDPDPWPPPSDFTTDLRHCILHHHHHRVVQDFKWTIAALRDPWQSQISTAVKRLHPPWSSPAGHCVSASVGIHHQTQSIMCWYSMVQACNMAKQIKRRWRKMSPMVDKPDHWSNFALEEWVQHTSSICRWHLMWKASSQSSVFMSATKRVFMYTLEQNSPWCTLVRILRELQDCDNHGLRLFRFIG